MATPVINACLVRILLPLLKFLLLRLLFDTGPLWCPDGLLRVDDFDASFGSQPNGKLRTLVHYLQRAHVTHEVSSVFRFDDAGGQKDRLCSHPSFLRNRVSPTLKLLMLDART